MAVNRETKVETSVQTYAMDKLRADGWKEEKLTFLEEFPHYGFFDGDLQTNYCAFGFNFDDQGRPAELGSSLRKRIYTLEFFVFGMEEAVAKAAANDLKFALDVDETVPLLDVGSMGMPVVDRLLVVGASAQKVLVADPKPFERHVWLTTARVEDEYFPASP